MCVCPCMSACVCTSTCGGQRLISGVCFYSSTLYVLRPLNSSSLSPTEQLVQGILRCWYNRQPQPHLPAIFNGPGDPISGHHTCMASGLPIEPLPQTPAMLKTFLNSILFKICLKLNLSSTHVSFHQQLLRVSRLSPDTLVSVYSECSERFRLFMATKMDLDEARIISPAPHKFWTPVSSLLPQEVEIEGRWN